MTNKQHNTAVIIWLMLAVLLTATVYITSDPATVLSSSFIGWCGGIAFVFAWLMPAEEKTTND